MPPELGGRQSEYEAEKITDIWSMPTSSGRDGHGAQFPLALPGRCIALSTHEGDLALDPFMGSGPTAVAALRLNRRIVGFDISDVYLATARERIARVLDAEQTATAQPRLPLI